jgi:hypothetical protein
MNSKMLRGFVVASFAAIVLILAGCNQREDKRTTDEKQFAPIPDLKTRYYFACPTCGCPQRPYRITEIRSYYRCSGNPPKFAYHTERLWQHAVEQDPRKRDEF